LILNPHIRSGSSPAKTKDWRADEFENLPAVVKNRELQYKVV
jgi:hypothetical protein